jgi:hypothetical protein
VGTKLSFNITFHTQINGHGVLNQYLKNYVNIDQRDWGEHLGLMEFCYNSITHLASKMSLFELALRKEAKKPMDLAIPWDKRTTPRKLWKWFKGVKSYTLEPRSFW